MTAINHKLELALCAYLATITELDAVVFYPGHGKDVMTAEGGHCIVTVAPGGGPLAYAGILQSEVEIVLLNSVEDLDAQSLQQTALQDALSLGSLPDLKAFINAPDSGPDSRAVKGIGLSDLKVKEPKEARDKERAEHGTGFFFDATYNAEEE